MPGTFSPPPIKRKPLVSYPDMHHGTYVTLSDKKPIGFLSDSGFARAVMHAGITGKTPRHFQRMGNPQFYVSGKKPLTLSKVRFGPQCQWPRPIYGLARFQPTRESATSVTPYWWAILIAHQLLWQNMEAPVSIFRESPLAGEPRERLFHIHSVNRYQLRTK